MAAFQGWATAVLRAVGAPLTKENLRFVQAWQRAEGGTASFNPLNTTQQWKNASSYNSVGVRNYTSAADGVAATAHTLLNGYYPKIVAGLRSGKLSAPQLASMTDELGKWGTGSGVLRVLNSGPVDVPHVGAPAAKAEAPSPAALTQQFAPDAYRHQAAAQLLQSSLALAQGGSIGDFAGGILGMAQQRQALMAAHQTFGESPHAGSLSKPPKQPDAAAPTGGGDWSKYVSLAPGADRAGVSTGQSVLHFVGQIGSLFGQPLTIGTGTNHHEYSRPGHVSDHWTGHAADIPASGSTLVKLGRDALIAAGANPQWARQQVGGLFNVNGHQIIFNTDLGPNGGGQHYDHLHVSA